MFFHFLSLSFTFFHFLSFSIIFYDFLSFSLSFVGCSKSDFFLGLNFVTISLDNSYVKNQFLGPSRVGTLWAPLFFFFLIFSYFFPTVFLSFSCFLFFIFSHFLCISSFFDFLMFFIFFFHFFRRKFSFFWYFLQICFNAGVSIRV